VLIGAASNGRIANQLFLLTDAVIENFVAFNPVEQKNQILSQKTAALHAHL